MCRKRREFKKKEFKAQARQVAEALAELDAKGWTAMFTELAELNPDDEFIPDPVDEYLVEAESLTRRIRRARKRKPPLDEAGLNRMMAQEFERSYEEKFPRMNLSRSR